MSSRRKIAFIFSSNGPGDLNPLKYAMEDANRVAESLSSPKCGFDVVRPTPGSDPFDLRRHLFTVTESCNPEDLLICYFSGHGVLESGSLFLLWDGTDINRPISTAIPVSDVLQALQYCKARGKLLILDCCSAGAAAGKFGMKNAAGIPVADTNLHAENHLVLMASGRFESARERKLRGSFLTVNICEALGDKLYDADADQDGRLSVNDLVRWLERQAREHNNQFPDCKVPIPYLFGQQKGEFFLTWEEADWKPYEFSCGDGSIMVVLPNFVDNDYPYSADKILCIGKYPVVNKQYEKFVKFFTPLLAILMSRPVSPLPKKAGQVRSALGKKRILIIRISRWCVFTYHDARSYCRWADSMHRIPALSTKGIVYLLSTYDLRPHRDWDFAAYGSNYHSRHPRSWLSRTPSIHHQASNPARIDFAGDSVERVGSLRYVRQRMGMVSRKRT